MFDHLPTSISSPIVDIDDETQIQIQLPGYFLDLYPRVVHTILDNLDLKVFRSQTFNFTLVNEEVSRYIEKENLPVSKIGTSIVGPTTNNKKTIVTLFILL